MWELVLKFYRWLAKCDLAAQEVLAWYDYVEIRRDGSSLSRWLAGRPLLTASAVPRKQSPGSELAQRRGRPPPWRHTPLTSSRYVMFLDETSDAGSLPFLSVSLSLCLSAYLLRSFSYIPRLPFHVSLSSPLVLAAFSSHSYHIYSIR